MTSLGWDGGSDVTRRPKRRASALAVSLTFSMTRKVTDPMGWLNRFRPTPGESTRTGPLFRSNWSRGPTPDSIRM